MPQRGQTLELNYTTKRRDLNELLGSTPCISKTKPITIRINRAYLLSASSDKLLIQRIKNVNDIVSCLFLVHITG